MERPAVEDRRGVSEERTTRPGATSDSPAPTACTAGHRLVGRLLDAHGRRAVTFRTESIQGGHEAAVVGEFNDWSSSAHPMARRGDDRFEVVVWLAPGRYRFRYLVDGHRWENDWHADAYEPNAFGGEDSVVDVPAGDERDERVEGRR